ncbi:ComF family protein [Anoxynatronum buryatiense]|uniref:Predicted amidophosphoribosyltransferases n=1 Tax=Anoxynatronum buryatiense TaxID=489973 RepID=A0AA46AKN3_9CLOT|nr:hypothetical protein [Anoxynatronum buryatiense]SMP71444.1 Predicted amidophosphoribosyltransferases [Anoxynatronum buryatiense]
MMKINPIKINGEWEEGFALGVHTLSSEYLGEDEYGRKQFDTIRSDIGQLVYELKYVCNRSKVDDIINLISPFLKKWNIRENIDIIIPVPPTKLERVFQPVFEITDALSNVLKISTDKGVLEKTNRTECKELSSVEKNKIAGTIQLMKRFEREVNILLVDDLYQSGTTLNDATKALKKDSNVKKVYVLTMTKTRR